MTHWIWNTDFFVFKRNSKIIILKNDINGAMVSLSPVEYDVLMAFCQQNSLEQVKNCLKDVCITTDIFQQLIDKAKKLNLLKTQNLMSSRKKQKDWQMKLYYLGMRLCQCLNRIFGLCFTAEFRGSLRFFKFFSINMEGSCWQKLAHSKKMQQCFWPMLAILYLLLIGNLCFNPNAHFAFSGFGMTSVPVMGLFLTMIACIFCCLFWHEMGHYFMYKRYGGEGDHIGLGVMFLVFPVLYTQIDDSCLWQKRKEKLTLSLAGIVMDGLLLLILWNILCFYHSINFGSLIAACLFYYYVVQLFTNMNPFFPGTDGYYLFEDILGLHRLYGNSFETAKVFWQEIKGFRLKRHTFREWTATAYFCTASLCISVYWLLITTLLTFPLWSNLLLNSH